MGFTSLISNRSCFVQARYSSTTSADVASITQAYKRTLQLDPNNRLNIHLMAADVTFTLHSLEWGYLTYEGAYRRGYNVAIQTSQHRNPGFMEAILCYATLRGAVRAVEKGGGTLLERKALYDKRAIMLNEILMYWCRTNRYGKEDAKAIIKRVADESWVLALAYVTELRTKLLEACIVDEMAAKITAMSLA